MANIGSGISAKSNSSKPKLQYPIHNPDDYKGKMIFKIIDEEAARSKAIGTFVDAANSTAQINAATASNPGIVEALKRKKDFASKKYNDQTVAPYVNREDNLTTDFDAGSVQLYLPQAIQIQDGASYNNNFELGTIGQSVEKGLLDGSSVINSMVGSVAQQAGQLSRTISGDNLALNKDLAVFGAAKLANKTGSTGVSGAVSSATGITSNPNVRTLFQSVPIRNFSFSFTLIPNSEYEADQIDKIIKWFRTELYPEALNVGSINYGYRFPNRFQISMRYSEEDSQEKGFNGIKFLPVYMQSFSASYNPNGMALHKNGKFHEIQITMSFIESRALNRQDIEDYKY